MTATAPAGLKAAIKDTNLLQDFRLPAAEFGGAGHMAAAGGAYAGGLRLTTAATAFTAAVRTMVATIGLTGVTGGKLSDARQSTVQRGNKMRALFAEWNAARL
jgi:hypothetical protein